MTVPLPVGPGAPPDVVDGAVVVLETEVVEAEEEEPVGV